VSFGASRHSIDCGEARRVGVECRASTPMLQLKNNGEPIRIGVPTQRQRRIRRNHVTATSKRRRCRMRPFYCRAERIFVSSTGRPRSSGTKCPSRLLRSCSRSGCTATFAGARVCIQAKRRGVGLAAARSMGFLSTTRPFPPPQQLKGRNKDAETIAIARHHRAFFPETDNGSPGFVPAR